MSTSASRIERWLAWYIDNTDSAEFLIVEAPVGWYVQWMYSSDGSLHTEASSLVWQATADASIDELLLPGPQHESLLGAGFAPPDEMVPNYAKEWAPGWDSAEVAAEAAWVFGSVYGLPADEPLGPIAAVPVPA